MTRIRLLVAFITLAGALAASPVSASALLVDNPAFAREGGLTTTPFGAYQFCRSHRSECGPDLPAAAHIDLTEALWSQLIAVNDDVNSKIAPESDEQLYGQQEYWTYPTTAGDCEDYVLAKRRALIGDGMPASALLIAVVRRVDGEGHAVLMVRTDRGDLVLDNLTATILTWDRTPYQYLKRQSEVDAGRWVTINDQGALVAGR